jgi:hypothetical protein
MRPEKTGATYEDGKVVLEFDELSLLLDDRGGAEIRLDPAEARRVSSELHTAAVMADEVRRISTKLHAAAIMNERDAPCFRSTT